MKKILSFLLLVGVMTSCQNEISDVNKFEETRILLTKEEAMSIANDTPTCLAEDDIIAMVNSFSNSLGVKTRSICHPKASIAGMYKIGRITASKATTRCTSTDSIPIYKVCLESSKGSGYAVVSADSRSAGILAYVEDGIFEERDSTGAGLMLNLAEITTISEINKIEKLKTELRDKTLKKIAISLGKSSITYNEIKNLISIDGILSEQDIISRSPSYDTPNSSIISIMPANGPLLKTKWHQKNPYNLFLPKCYDNWHIEQNYPMGCALVAGAQTLAAIAPNMTINDTIVDWAMLTKNPTIEYNTYTGGDYEGAKMVSTLVKHMYEETASKPIIDNSFKHNNNDDPNIPCVTGSYTYTDKLLSYLKKYVSCGTYYTKYTPDALITTINTNRTKPCVAIMGGTHSTNEQTSTGSHAWVIDGYAICVKTSREILKSNDLYFHANMGWGGRDNGFYKVNSDTSIDFETDNGNYNANYWEITEIHKK